MSNDSPPATLSLRSQALLDYLSGLAIAAAPTPYLDEMLTALRAQGHGAPLNTGIATYEVSRLVKAGLIRIHGSQARRAIEIVATGAMTTRRPMSARSLLGARSGMLAAQRRRKEEAEGWPRPTARSIAAYDAAMAEQPYAHHQSGEGPMPFQAIRSAYGNRSLVGSAGAMCADGQRGFA
jgi:hypothetical protein